MAGSIVSVDGNGRVTLVAGLAVAVGWTRQKHIVTAELVEPGIFRVYDRDRLAPHVASLLAQADDLDVPLRMESKAALADRYRDLTLYADGRLQLTKEVAAWVGYYPFPVTPAHLFAEAFALGIAVMTPERRASRMAGLGLPLFQDS